MNTILSQSPQRTQRSGVHESGGTPDYLAAELGQRPFFAEPQRLSLKASPEVLLSDVAAIALAVAVLLD